MRYLLSKGVELGNLVGSICISSINYRDTEESGAVTFLSFIGETSTPRTITEGNQAESDEFLMEVYVK